MDCPRFNKWIRGCKFEPRYDLSSPDQRMKFIGRQTAKASLGLANGIGKATLELKQLLP